MPDVLATNDYEIARLLIERGLGVIYLIAFAVAFVQFPALAGEHGLDPTPELLRYTTFRETPSIFHLRYVFHLLRVVAALGVVRSALVLIGIAAALPIPIPMLVLLSM